MGIFSSIGGAFKEGWNSAKDTKENREKLTKEHIEKNPYSSFYKENIGKLSFINDNSNITQLQQTADYQNYSNLTVNKEFIYENPFKLSQEVLDNSTKNYQFIYKKPAYILGEYGIVGKDKNGKDLAGGEYYTMPIIPSMFNPLYGINIIGMDSNTPVINTPDNILYEYNGKSIKKTDYPDDLSDCSIKTLVKLSDEGKLGRGIFKYADFMYCKNLGKISNNRLLTLRRFPVPIGDDIWSVNQQEKGGANISGDIGRLVTWMDDNNKLEDILKYNYKDSFEPKTGHFSDASSTEDDSHRGILGAAINLANPNYRIGDTNKTGMAGWGNENKILGMVFDQSFLTGANSVSGGDSENVRVLWERYDNNRIYEPKGTVRDTHLYEGKLTFEQNFSLTFDYELRAYENINPRTAFLDLLNNIQQVTYRKGNFWGGAVWWKGAPANTKGWQTANAMIDGAWDKLSGTFQMLCSGEMDLGNFFAGLWSNLEKAGSTLLNSIGNAVSDPQKLMQDIYDKLHSVGAGNMLKSMIKNKLGRPALYATDSILSGEPVGLWHLTIGNPRNPIMCMGNLIIDGSTIQQYGPLGLDDFPTGLKVTINLKHGKSRDMMEIGKMYTMGRAGLGVPLGRTLYSDLISNASGIPLEIVEASMRNKTTGEQYKLAPPAGYGNNIFYTANQFGTMWASTMPTANEYSRHKLSAKDPSKVNKEK